MASGTAMRSPSNHANAALRAPRCATTGDAAAVLRFVAALYGTAPDGALVELRPLPVGRARRQFIRSDDPDALVRVAELANAAGADVYLGVNPRARAGGEATDVAATVVLVVDLDVGEGKSFATKAAALESLNRLRFAGLAPSIVVDSGGGFHAYWLLAEPLPAGEHAPAQAAMARLRHFLARDVPLDDVSDAPRILRMPGTTNRKLSGNPRPVRLVACDPNRRFDLEDFDILPEAPEASAPDAEPVELPRDLSPKAARIVELLDEAGWRPKVKRSGGRISAVVIGRVCPACATVKAVDREPPRGGTAHIAPMTLALRCKRARCPAGGLSGTDARGNAVGLSLHQWLPRFAPDVAKQIAPPALETIEPVEIVDIANVAEAEQPLDELLERAAAVVESTQGFVAVSTPPGVGKTHAALRRFVEQRKGTLLGASHEALDAREGEAQALGLRRRRRYRGLLAVCDDVGKPACAHAERLKSWASRGDPLRSIACASCSHRRDWRNTGKPCPAYVGAEGRGARFAAHAQAPHLTDELRAPVFCDELPSPLTIARGYTRADQALTVDELAGPVTMTHTRDLLEDWCAARRPLTNIIVRAARALAHDWARASKGERRHAWRVSGDKLRGRLRAAATDPQQQAELFAGLEPGELALDKAIQELNVAVTLDPDWPQPEGREVCGGYIDPARWPRRDTDDLLRAIAGECTGAGGGACLVVDGRGVSIEHRRRTFDRWPGGVVFLDASAATTSSILRAAIAAERPLQFLELRVAEVPGAVRRVHLITASSLTRAALLATRTRLSDRGGAAVARVVRQALREVGGRSAVLGIVTHKPIAQIINACAAVIDGRDEDGEKLKRIKRDNGLRVLAELQALRARGRLGEFKALAYGAQRGSNVLERCDTLSLLGDPWADVGAATEDAHALGLPAAGYIQALCDAETLQALGRARAVRRTTDNPVNLVYAGAVAPRVWAGLAVRSVEMAQGGPLASETTTDVAELVQDIAESAGAVGGGLLGWLVKKAQRFGGCALTVTSIDLSSSWGRSAKTLENFVTDPRLGVTADLSARALAKVVERALGKVPLAQTPNPDGTGGWTWREARPGAAAELLEVLRAIDTAQAQADFTAHAEQLAQAARVDVEAEGGAPADVLATFNADVVVASTVEEVRAVCRRFRARARYTHGGVSISPPAQSAEEQPP